MPTAPKPSSTKSTAAKSTNKAANKSAAVKSRPLSEPEDTLHQVAALPLRINNGMLEVCLVTTRETRRWTIPKGWPMKGKDDRQAASIEATQEGGLVGTIGKKPIGSFLYWKRRPMQLDLVRVQVYRLDVTEQLSTWREAHERYVMWFPIGVAEALVEEEGLQALLREVAEPSPAS